MPGSTLDTLMPTHIEGPQAIRVTGTSQATAVTAGAVAVLLQQRPQLSPDAVKAVLVGSAHTLTGTARNAQGAGSVDVAAAILAPTPRVKSQPTRVSHAFARSVLPLLRSQVVRVQGRQIQWDQIQWDQIQWDQIQWDQIQWDQIQWDQIQWDQIQWDAATGSQPLGTVPLD